MPTPVQKEKGPRGLAKLTVTDKKVRVAYEDGVTYDVFPEDIPELFPILKEIGNVQCNVNMNVDGTKIYNVSPPGNKSYFCKFTGFTHEADKPPMPKLIQGRSGQKQGGGSYVIPDHLGAYALFDIIEGKFKGLHIVYEVWYSFKSNPGFDNTMVTGRGYQRTEEFMRMCGFDFTKDEIPWSDNILPFLQKLLLERSVPVAIRLNDKGYVDTIGDVPDGMVFEKPTAKRAKK